MDTSPERAALEADIARLRLRLAELDASAPPPPSPLEPEAFRRFFEAALDPIFVADPATGRLLDANPRACELVGRSLEEIRSLHQTDLHPPGRREEARANFERVIRFPDGKPIATEVLHRDGRTFPAEVNVGNVRLSNGQTVHFGIFRDATAHRESEDRILRSRDRLAEKVEMGVAELREAYAAVRRESTEKELALARLRENEERLEKLVAERTAELARTVAELRETSDDFRRLFASMAEGFVLHGADGRIVDANPAAERILGLTREELLGRTSHDPRWRCLREDGSDFPGDEHPAMVTLRTGRPVTGVVMGIVDPRAAARRWLLVGATPHFRGIAATPYQVHATFVDITELRKAAEARRALEVRMQQAQRFESLGRLAGGVAHDFNNILAAILGQADLLLLDEPPDSATGAALREIVGAARGASDLCRQLLDFTGRGPRAPEPIDLARLVEEMSGLLRLSVGKGTTLRILPAGPAPLLAADRPQLRQVAMNLVLNAAEAIGERGGTIAVSVAARPGADGTAPGVALQVADDGPGIDAESRARLFEPFFSTKQFGRGLGLATVDGIVRGHGGFVEVESSPGGGATFRAWFPAAPLSATAAGAPVPTGGALRAPRTLLLADDEPGVLAATARLLERGLGFRVEAVTGGREAVARFRERPDDFAGALVDLTMPDLDGLAVRDRLREIRPALPVVLMSGLDVAAEGVAALPGDPTPLLSKPFQLADLAAALSRALGPAGAGPSGPRG